MTKKRKTKIIQLLIVTIIWLLVIFGTTSEVETVEVAPYISVSDFIVIVDKPIEVVEVVEPIEEVVVVKDDLYWMARIISAEAKGEPVEGQIAVGNVVLNRVKQSGFPDTIKGVIFQKKQFDPVRNGSIYHEPTGQAIESAKRVLAGEKVVSDGAVFFYNHNTVSRNSWIRTRQTIQDIGNHRFAK